MTQTTKNATNAIQTSEIATQPKSVLITGATGLVGQALQTRLSNAGTEVRRLVRSNPTSTDALWDPASGTIDQQAMGARAVVHLAGESIAEGRWNTDKMERIRDSRVRGTKLLAETLASAKVKPEVLISASAIGFYGDRGEELLNEDSLAGEGFLADVCREWEAATQPARDAGIRVVNLRIGVVLDSKGGALAKMLTPFKFGLGGRLGSGQQYMSWVGLTDLVSVICYALENEKLQGPVNATAPNPVTNAEFTKALGWALRRPTIATVPAPAARLAFGKMADALLLSSARVAPDALLKHGFEFAHPELGAALEDIL